MKKPTKAQLYEQVAEMERLQEKMFRERDREKIKKWNEQLPTAYAVCRKSLQTIFPGAVELLHFEHVDGGGFWFTFQLVNDKRRQTYAVRHYEIEDVEKCFILSP